MSTERKDIYVPKRKYKKIEKDPLEKRKEMFKIKKLSKDIKDELKIKYIDESRFHEILKRVSISQIERFDSLLREKGYSLKDKEITEFVVEQIKRFEDADKNPNKANGEFYKLFKEEFMSDKYDGNFEKNKFLIELMKKYVRYNAGIENMKEDN